LLLTDETLKSKKEYIFKKIWEKTLATPIKCLKYSPDGLLFASFGEVIYLSSPKY